MKYRKKPIAIEAWQFTKGNYTKSNMPVWLTDAIKIRTIQLYSQHGGSIIGGNILTLEGVMTISENDWLIKGVNGEFYPCKPDIFEKSYEEETK